MPRANGCLSSLRKTIGQLSAVQRVLREDNGVVFGQKKDEQGLEWLFTEDLTNGYVKKTLPPLLEQLPTNAF